MKSAASAGAVVPAEAAEYKLGCLAEGDQRPFAISISTKQNIFELQEQVLQKCKHDQYFHGVGAKNLSLTKVRHITIFM